MRVTNCYLEKRFALWGPSAMEHTQYAECNVGGVIAGWDARAGGWTPGAARRQGGVQNRALCPENWHPPGGVKKSGI